MSTACENQTDRPSEDRGSCASAIFIVPWNGGRPVNERLVYGITKDLSSQAMTVVLCEQITGNDELLFGFWCEGPMLMRGAIQSQEYIGGGFWQFRVQFQKTVQARQVDGTGYIEKCIRYLNPEFGISYDEVGDDRRNTYRISSEETARSAILNFKGKNIVAKIVNESTDGLLASIPKGRPFKLGQTLTLITGNGCWKSEVVRCESAKDELRVGLRRLREVAFRPGNRDRLMVWVLMLLSAALAVLAALR